MLFFYASVGHFNFYIIILVEGHEILSVTLNKKSLLLLLLLRPAKLRKRGGSSYVITLFDFTTAI